MSYVEKLKHARDVVKADLERQPVVDEWDGLNYELGRLDALIETADAEKRPSDSVVFWRAREAPLWARELVVSDAKASSKWPSYKIGFIAWVPTKFDPRKRYSFVSDIAAMADSLTRSDTAFAADVAFTDQIMMSDGRLYYGGNQSGYRTLVEGDGGSPWEVK